MKILSIEEIKSKLKEENYKHIFEWTDEPNTIYDSHSHNGRVCFYVLSGSVCFGGDIKAEVKTGERFDVPIGIKHTAVVGVDGCHYIVGEDIEGDS